ncbi:hypothetical protein EYF80_049256 [Liparis tanakae]|uniref:Uncharacterized protein n=1 Tax=Liparis tanakae TaxID=230148 RepID=A0A4Z2FI18_9TELE|nr:hypothetical protein EYF80_049256 [Liparis tanakae]
MENSSERPPLYCDQIDDVERDTALRCRDGAKPISTQRAASGSAYHKELLETSTTWAKNHKDICMDDMIY